MISFRNLFLEAYTNREDIFLSTNESRREDGLPMMTGNFLTGKIVKAFIFFLLVFCVFYLPFINKAFHIDDVDFMHFSEMIGWNPLNSTPVDYPYNGQILKDYMPAYEMTHPLVVPYAIKIVSALFGQNEVVLHLSFFFFSLLSLI